MVHDMLDYKKLGIRAGLEIHQQLSSGTKLFCRCPIKKSDDFPIEIRRKLRPVQSELGEKDPAALFEYLRDKTFVYRANRESSCLVELDEQPPLPMNEKALKTVIQIGKMLNCRFVDEIHVMRKMVIDGSAVSGFQRTALIATDGGIETSLGSVGIQTINLEEDSAPAMTRGNNIEYRLDRLGTPLIEIATDSSLSSPQHVREAAEKIGLLLRSVDVVRGIGSIRQDVNISIAEGSRVEIKGFQQLEDMEKLVENEVLRQIGLLEVRDELRKRGFREVKEDIRDVTKIFEKTKNMMISKIINEGGRIFASVLRGFGGLMKKELGDRTLGKELSGYADSYGYGIIHNVEAEKHAMVDEFRELEKIFGATENDVTFISAGKNPKQAITAVIKRTNYCSVGVPEETRVADGIGSKYSRPLPGSGRLYPESDVPAIRVTKELLNVEVPKTLDERKKELDIPEQLASQIVKSRYYSWFNELKNYDHVLAATVFLSTYKDLSRHGFDVDKISFEDVKIVIENASNGKIPKNSIGDILSEVCGGVPAASVIAKYSLISDEELIGIIKTSMKENSGKNDSALTGIVMGKVKGHADGKKVADLIKELR